MERFLADHLGDALLDRLVSRLVPREEQLAVLRQEEDEVAAQLVDAVLRLRADRMERVEVAERGGDLHLARDVRRAQPVDLVQRDDHRHAAGERAPGDEAIARADALARVEDNEHDVHVVEGCVDGRLHPVGERVHRPLEPGQIDEDELVVGAVRDSEDPAAGGVRHLRGDRDLVAAERIDERRLADVRPAGERDEA